MVGNEALIDNLIPMASFLRSHYLFYLLSLSSLIYLPCQSGRCISAILQPEAEQRISLFLWLINFVGDFSFVHRREEFRCRLNTDLLLESRVSDALTFIYKINN